MSTTPIDEGLELIDEDLATRDPEFVDEGLASGDPAWVDAFEDGPDLVALDGDTDLESLRDEFVDAFNARDLDAVVALVTHDVECPDVAGDGVPVLAEELEAIWERSPGALLTRAFSDGRPCAVGWLPDEDGCWSRAALVCFDCDNGLLSLVELPDDVDALERAEAEEPTGELVEEWADWAEWERGEESPGHRR